MARRAIGWMKRGGMAVALAVLAAAAPAPAPTPELAALEQMAKVEAAIEANDLPRALAAADAALRHMPEPGLPRGLVQNLRSAILKDMGRNAEALAAIEEAVAMLPDSFDTRLSLADLQRGNDKPVDAARTVIFIADSFPGQLGDLNAPWVYALMRDLDADATADARFDLLLTLALRGFDTGEYPGDGDSMLSDAVRGLVDRDRADEAAPFLAKLTDTSTMIELMIDRRYRAFWPALEAKVGPRGVTALAAERAAFKAAWEAAPDDIEHRRRYMASLRAEGRSAEAVTLAGEYGADMAKVAADGDDAFWMVNARAQALVAANRIDEADALFGRLVGLGIEKHPTLVSMAINHAMMLQEQGRPAASIAATDRLAALDAKYMSDYGHMFIWKAQACANFDLGREAAVTAALAKLQAKPKNNIQALMSALLCTGRLDAAEKLVLDRLADPRLRAAMLTAFQDFDAPSTTSPAAADVRAKMLALRDRPAVRKAIAEHGRILSFAAPHEHWSGV